MSDVIDEIHEGRPCVRFKWGEVEFRASQIEPQYQFMRVTALRPCCEDGVDFYSRRLESVSTWCCPIAYEFGNRSFVSLDPKEDQQMLTAWFRNWLGSSTSDALEIELALTELPTVLSNVIEYFREKTR